MEERKKTGKSYLWALFAFLLAVAADQFTKWLAVTYLKDQDPLIIIPGVFQFRYLENRGAAFGILILFYYKDQEFDWVLQKKGSRS